MTGVRGARYDGIADWYDGYNEAAAGNAVSRSASGTCRMPSRLRTPPGLHHGAAGCHPAAR